MSVISQGALAKGNAKIIATGESRVLRKIDSERFKGFSPKLLSIMQLFSDEAHRYLAAPTIRDSFENHDNRREWRNLMREEYGPEVMTYLKSNRLGINSITKINSALNLTISYLDREQAANPDIGEFRMALAGLHTLYAEKNLFGDGYRTGTHEYRMQAIEQLADALRTYLDVVEGYPTQPSQT